MTVPSLLARWLSGGVLALTGFLKVVHPPEEFALSIESFRVLPPALTIPVAVVFPWFELFIGVFLLLGFLTRWSSGAAMVIYAGFCLLWGSVLWRGILLEDCGCFGGWGPTLTPWQMLFLDGFLTLASLWVWRDKEKKFSLDHIVFSHGQ